MTLQPSLRPPTPGRPAARRWGTKAYHTQPCPWRRRTEPPAPGQPSEQQSPAGRSDHAWGVPPPKPPAAHPYNGRPSADSLPGRGDTTGAPSPLPPGSPMVSPGPPFLPLPAHPKLPHRLPRNRPRTDRQPQHRPDTRPRDSRPNVQDQPRVSTRTVQLTTGERVAARVPHSTTPRVSWTPSSRSASSTSPTHLPGAAEPPKPHRIWQHSRSLSMRQCLVLRTVAHQNTRPHPYSLMPNGCPPSCSYV
jgi:hypothetical protein